MPEQMYFEDFYPGQIFDSERSYRVTAKEIISFERSTIRSFSYRRDRGQEFVL